MAESFAGRTSEVAAIRGALGVYSFSTRILLEIVQNTEDAGGTRQIFVLDKRRHRVTKGGLYNPKLESLQGPALLAFNDAKFRDADWRAMQTLYESSKGEDITKIGKFGVGFRSVYHLTDCPQILSGESLALSDPLQQYTDGPGISLHLPKLGNKLEDQLASFSHFLSADLWDANAGHYEGTVIRCPLRTRSSKISDSVPTTNAISRLFREFCNTDLGIALLFLQKLRKIEVLEIEEDGSIIPLGTCTIARASLPFPLNPRFSAVDVSAQTTLPNKDTASSWKLLHCKFSEEEVKAWSPIDAEALKKNKFIPQVSLAIPSSTVVGPQSTGRLFTFLPLETKTGLPFHIHASFGLTQSRTNLCNKGTQVVPGSLDALMITFNNLLFDELVPRAWKTWLESYAGSAAPTFDIFNIWPSYTPRVLTGDSVYWQTLPEHVFTLVTRHSLSIWPAYPPPSTRFLPLQDYLTAIAKTDRKVLDALVALGVKITTPPDYIVDIIRNQGDDRFKLLSPRTAHACLLASLPFPSDAARHTKVVADYLLSTSDVRNIIGLPLFVTLGGTVVALQAKSTASRTHTLLTRSEFDVFQSCDDDALSVTSIQLSPASLDLLKEKGPQELNIELLSIPTIITYIAEYPKALSVDSRDVQKYQHTVRWLSKVWVWMASLPYKDKLFEAFGDTALVLPSTAGLKPLTHPLFKSRNEYHVAVRHLQTLGIAFLHKDITDTAHAFIDAGGFSKLVNNISDLLLYITPDSETKLTSDSAIFLLRHISDRIDASGQLPAAQVNNLKAIPIFPLFQSPRSSGAQGLAVSWVRAPSDTTICAITDPGYLPSIPGLTFADARYLKPSVLRQIQDQYHLPLDDSQLLERVLDNFISQTLTVRVAILTSLNRRMLPLDLVEKLKNIAFVEMQDGSFRTPCDTIDPNSTIHQLYQGDPTRLAKNSTMQEKALLSQLRLLRLLRHTLTVEMVDERAAYLSEHHEAPSEAILQIAKSLLRAIPVAEYSRNQLMLPQEVEWIPTIHGALVKPSVCREEGSLRSSLFDRVYSVLDKKVVISSEVRRLLGWDAEISTEVIIEQLSCVVNDENEGLRRNEVLTSIIKALASRVQRDEGIIERVREVVLGKRWIPTSSGNLGTISDTVFLPPPSGINFHQVYPILIVSKPEAKGFLARVGVLEKPSIDALVDQLLECTNEDITQSVHLLKAICNTRGLTEEHRSHMVVPDSTNHLRPLLEVAFNDLGPLMHLAPLTETDFVTHPDIDEPLATALEIEPLGRKFAGLKDVPKDMGVDTLDFVRDTLKQYTKHQFATEFLANAIDAGAKHLCFCLNDWFDGSGGNVMSNMRKVVDVPSLVVFNDACFKEEDFEGLLRSSVGSKKGRKDAIGQFGRGALTMFYFTELAIIVSGDKVLLLNPSRELFGSHSGMLYPLQIVKKCYPGLLKNIDGLFSFDADPSDPEPYPGTIFYLPLRSFESTHATQHGRVAHQDYPSIDNIRQEIFQPFFDIAHECLLFTDFDSISLVSRGEEDIPYPLSLEWRVAGQVVEVSQRPDGIKSWSATIDQEFGDQSEDSHWMVAECEVPAEHVPPHLSLQLDPDGEDGEVAKTQRVGVAFCLDDAPPTTTGFRYFSTLPLAERTELPAHINASFRLSQDRRSIRFDALNTGETEYNRWLLTDQIPRLYLFLLARVLQRQDCNDNTQWWPYQPHTSNAEVLPITKEFENAFYSSHLAHCSEEIFAGYFDTDNTVGFRDAVVLLDDEVPHPVSRLVRNAVGHNEFVIKPPTQVATRLLEVGAQPVTPEFLKQILTDPRVCQAFQTDVDFLDPASMSEFHQVLGFISRNTHEALYDLEILPLADGTWAKFGPRGFADQYFTSKKLDLASNSSLFPLSRFAHPKLKTKFLKSDATINISKLDEDAVRTLVRDRVVGEGGREREPDRLEDVDDETIVWIRSLWEHFNDLEVKIDALSHLPLVQTTQEGVFVSLNRCRVGSTLLLRNPLDLSPDEREAFENLNLDLVVIHGEDFPATLRSVLAPCQFEGLTLTRVLRALSDVAQNLLTDIPTLISTLGEGPSRVAFSRWTRERIHSIAGELIPDARTLAIWPAASKETQGYIDYRPSAEVHMLPVGFAMEHVARFVSVLVSDNGPLAHLGGPTLSPDELLAALDLDETMDEPDHPHYFSLLSTLLPKLSASPSSHIKIPNSQLRMVNTRTLYARDDLFLSAYGDTSERFAHISFLDLEDSLIRYGLRNDENFDVEVMKECILAIGNRTNDDGEKMAAAQLVYGKYSTRDYRAADDTTYEALFADIRHIRFIPRDMDYQRRLEVGRPGLQPPPHIQGLPGIVSPDELVAEEFAPVAWSQRAMFAQEPALVGRACQPELGVPSYREVIEHLRYLANRENWELLSDAKRTVWHHDLMATYLHLNHYLVGHEVDISELSSEALFLNVFDPNSVWRFEAGHNLAFIPRDDEVFRAVCTPLLPFRNLLLQTGAIPVKQPAWTNRLANEDPSSSDTNIRNAFNEYRASGLFVDVEFYAVDDPRIGERQPLLAHRAYLAASAEHFKDAFTSDFSEAKTEGRAQYPVSGYSYNCVKFALDYIYTGSFEGASMSEIDLMLELLGLADYWGIDTLSDAVQRHIVQMNMVTPSTVRSIYTTAVEIKANDLIDICQTYMSNNSAYIREHESRNPEA